jgi:hypothetical protein
MNKIIGAGIILMLAGCVPAISEVKTAGPTPAGWYSPHRADLQLSQDRDHCHTACLSA